MSVKSNVFKFEIDELKELASDLNDLVERLELINEKNEVMNQKLRNSGIPEEYLYKMYEIFCSDIDDPEDLGDNAEEYIVD